MGAHKRELAKAATEFIYSNFERRVEFEALILAAIEDYFYAMSKKEIITWLEIQAGEKQL